MQPDDLWRTYPVLYHIAWGGSWSNIREYGLLSSTVLLRLYGKSATEIEGLTRCRRPHWVTIECPGRPQAVLRDQKPLNDAGIRRALGGKVEPWQWYDLINSMVFFWPTKKRLETMISAAAYEGLCHDVLVVDTKALVRLEAVNIRLSRMNSGSTNPMPHPRDMGLFKTVSDYPFESRLRKYGRACAVAEVCVLEGVRRIGDAVLDVKSGSASEVMSRLATY